VTLGLTQPVLTPSLTGARPAREHVQSEAAIGDVAELTRRLAQGDESAFRAFHERYFDRLYQFLLVVARGQEHEAQEALQETLLRVARQGREFTGEDAFWCWLKTVARNAARDGGRKRSRYANLLRKFALERTPQGGTHPGLEEARLLATLTECLNELPLEDRRLLEGKYLEGATVREIAGATSLSEKTVESRLGRLRQRLRESLLNRLNEP